MLPHSVQSINTIHPRNCHKHPRKDFVNLPDQFVGLVDSKIGMEEDSTRQQWTHHGNHESDSDLSVRRREMGRVIQVLVVINRVQASQGQHVSKAGQHSVQLRVGVSPQFFGDSGDSHGSRHSHSHQKGMPRKGRLPFSLWTGGDIPTDKQGVGQKGDYQQPVARLCWFVVLHGRCVCRSFIVVFGKIRRRRSRVAG